VSYFCGAFQGVVSRGCKVFHNYSFWLVNSIKPVRISGRVFCFIIFFGMDFDLPGEKMAIFKV